MLNNLWQLIKDWPAAAVGRAGWETAVFVWLVAAIVSMPFVVWFIYLSN